MTLFGKPGWKPALPSFGQTVEESKKSQALRMTSAFCFALGGSPAGKMRASRNG
jgi:hypothetical protein